MTSPSREAAWRPTDDVHLGGLRAMRTLIERQASYETLVASGTGRVLKIVDEATGQGVGGIVYWSGPGMVRKSTKSAGP